MGNTQPDPLPDLVKIHDNNTWKVSDVIGKLARKELDPSPDFQRFYVWDYQKQTGLIDTLIRGWPIPPIWVRYCLDDAGVEVSELIDGQQRLRTLQKFVDGDFSYLPAETGLKSDIPQKYAAHYDTLDPELKKRFMSASISAVVCDISYGTQIREIFKRLNQSAMNLTGQELRNCAWRGQFKQAVYQLTQELQTDDFWSTRVWRKPERDRMLGQTRVSELLVALLAESPLDRSDQVDKSYEQYEKNWEERSKVIKRFKKTVKTMTALFRGGAVDGFTKNWSEFYTLFLLVAQWQREGKVIGSGMGKKYLIETLVAFGDAFQRYKDSRKLLIESGQNVEPGDIFEQYNTTITSENNKLFSRQNRARILEELIGTGLSKHKRHSQRSFSPIQRGVIFNRTTAVKEDGTRVRECDGKGCTTKLTPNSVWEADHIKPHANGGLTVVSNGQALCESCHNSKHTGK